MRGKVRAALSAVLAVGLTLVASVAPAAARTTGRESFKGTIVKDESGNVVSTLLVAKGVFTGTGRIVEVDNRPGDPENVNRDNLVFRRAPCTSAARTSVQRCRSTRRLA